MVILKTLFGILGILLVICIFWLAFGDDDFPVIFRMFIFPILCIIGIIILGGYYLGNYVF